jgi:hypothetical protein
MRKENIKRHSPRLLDTRQQILWDYEVKLKKFSLPMKTPRPAHRGIMPQALGAVHVRLSREAAKYWPPNKRMRPFRPVRAPVSISAAIVVNSSASSSSQWASKPALAQPEHRPAVEIKHEIPRRVSPPGFAIAAAITKTLILIAESLRPRSNWARPPGNREYIFSLSENELFQLS